MTKIRYSKISAAYIITHRITGHFYIGSSGRIQERLVMHKSNLKQKRHPNFKLSQIYTTWDDFDICIFTFATLSEARDKEQELLDLYLKQPLCCNTANDVRRTWKPGTVPQSVLERLRAGGIASKGHKGRLGIPHTPASRAKISATKSTKVNVDGCVYLNARAVATAFNIPYQTVITRINAKSKKFAGWFYLTDP